MARQTKGDQDHDAKLIEIFIRFDEMRKDLNEFRNLEKRVDDLETFKSILKGAGIILGAILTILGAIATDLIDHIKF